MNQQGYARLVFKNKYRPTMKNTMTESEVLADLEHIQFPLRMAPLVGVQGYTPQGYQQQGYPGMPPSGYQQGYQQGMPPSGYQGMPPSGHQQGYQQGYKPPNQNSTLPANTILKTPYQKVTPTNVTQSKHVSSIAPDLCSCRFARDLFLFHWLFSGPSGCTGCENGAHAGAGVCGECLAGSLGECLGGCCN